MSDAAKREFGRLMEEVEKLRDEHRQDGVIVSAVTKRNIEYEEAIDRLRTENEKLRKLAHVMYCHYNHSGDCDNCLMYNDGMRVEISNTEFCDEMYGLMQDLGIEVG